MRAVPLATPIALTTEEQGVLEALAHSTKSEARMRDRARIVLLAAAGIAKREIGRIVGCTTGTASKWRVRHARARLAGLDETGNRGAAPKYGSADQQRILGTLDQLPPEGYSNWTARLLARALGDVHEQYIWCFLRAQKIDLSGRKSWCESNDPEFVAKAAGIVGLYLAPPEKILRLVAGLEGGSRRNLVARVAPGEGPESTQGGRFKDNCAAARNRSGNPSKPPCRVLA
jgi:transposase